jgi:hypothetical protein
MSKFTVGDKAIKTKGYEFPCTIVAVFKTTKGDTRIVGEMDGYGLLHIFNEDQLTPKGDTTTDEEYCAHCYHHEHKEILSSQCRHANVESPTTTDAVEEQVEEFIHLFTGITAPNDVVRDFLRTAFTQAEARGFETALENRGEQTNPPTP